MKLTFKDRGTIRHVRRVDGLRFRHRQSRKSELITVRRQAGRRPVHRFELGLRDNIHAEGALVEDVAERILGHSSPGPDGQAHKHGRGRHGREEAERSHVGNAVHAPGRNPADRARNDKRREKLVPLLAIDRVGTNYSMPEVPFQVGQAHCTPSAGLTEPWVPLAADRRRCGFLGYRWRP